MRMGRPRSTRKDLPPGLYWDDRRGYYARINSKFTHIGKVNVTEARKVWIKLTARRYEDDALPGTFAALLEQYQERGLPLVPAEATRKEYTRQLPKLRARWGARLYAKTDSEAIQGKGKFLLPLDFTAYLEQFQPVNGKAVRGATMARQDARLVSSIFSWGIAHGYTLFNPVIGCKIPTITPKKAKLDAPTRRAIGAKIAPAVRLMMEFGALTGMRKTDIRLLTKAQIKEKLLEVRQSKRGTEQEWDITPALEAVLKAAERLPGAHKSKVVFPCRKGTAYTENGLQSAWRRARTKAGATGYVFRDIRRKAINEARRRGDATDFAGHQDPRTTARHYYTEAIRVKPLDGDGENPAPLPRDDGENRRKNFSPNSH